MVVRKGRGCTLSFTYGKMAVVCCGCTPSVTRGRLAVVCKGSVCTLSVTRPWGVCELYQLLQEGWRLSAGVCNLLVI